jgi:S-(hydroxymethyl)glutathione dehydrogenase/alcohol dehydrogenase
MCCIGTFGEYTVCAEASCIKIEPDIPLDKAALVGCGVTTGWGSAVYAAGVQPGETVVVVGCGGVGMNAVQGAAMAGASHVIAIDPVEFKREQAQVFGATHSAPSIEEAVALVTDLTWGVMADKVISTMGVGDGHLVDSILTLCAKGGRTVWTNVAGINDTEVTLNLFNLTLLEKQLVGSIFGSANPRRDIPRLLRLYQEGKLKLDELITATYPLRDINVGYQDMRDGKNVRGMVMYDHA